MQRKYRAEQSSVMARMNMAEKSNIDLAATKQITEVASELSGNNIHVNLVEI